MDNYADFHIKWVYFFNILNRSFVKSGIYQLPIFAGQVPIELVKEMQRGDPWELIEDKLKLKKGGLKYVDAMSAIVRLLDG